MYAITSETVESDQYLTGRGTWEDMKDTVKRFVFAKMLQLTDDKVKHFRGDMFSDAIHLNETLDLDFTDEKDNYAQGYIFTFDTSGTFLFEAKQFFNEWHPIREEHQYKLVVYRKGGPEYFSFYLMVLKIKLEVVDV